MGITVMQKKKGVIRLPADVTKESAAREKPEEI